MFLGLFFTALLLAGVVYELVSGKLLGRNWRVYSSRKEQPKLYWITMVLQIIAVSVMIYMIVHDHLIGKR